MANLFVSALQLAEVQHAAETQALERIQGAWPIQEKASKLANQVGTIASACAGQPPATAREAQAAGPVGLATVTCLLTAGPVGLVNVTCLLTRRRRCFVRLRSRCAQVLSGELAKLVSATLSKPGGQATHAFARMHPYMIGAKENRPAPRPYVAESMRQPRAVV